MPLEVEPGRVPLLTEVVELDPTTDDGQGWPPASPLPDAGAEAASPGEPPASEMQRHAASSAWPDAYTSAAADAPWDTPGGATAGGTSPPVPLAPAGPAPVDVDVVVQQVLQRLGPQLDEWLDRRWQDAVAPALQRALDEWRAAVAPALRDRVADAVRQALRAPAPGADPGGTTGD